VLHFGQNTNGITIHSQTSFDGLTYSDGDIRCVYSEEKFDLTVVTYITYKCR